MRAITTAPVLVCPRIPQAHASPSRLDPTKRSSGCAERHGGGGGGVKTTDTPVHRMLNSAVCPGSYDSLLALSALPACFLAGSPTLTE